MTKLVRGTTLALVTAFALSASATPIPPRVRLKEQRLRKQAEDKRIAADKPPFEFSAPEGFTVTEKVPAKDGEPAAPDFAATSLAPPATMTATVEKGALVVDDALLAEHVKKLTEKFVAAHPGATVKLVKKERVKLDEGEAGRIVLDTKLDAKKATKAQREVHYLVSNSTHHAEVVYTTAAAGFAKLDKKLDASLRKTLGINSPGAAASPAPAAAPAAK